MPCRTPDEDGESIDNAESLGMILKSQLALNTGLICWEELFEGHLNIVECLLKRSLNEGLRNI
jgi:hypothetical protein